MKNKWKVSSNVSFNLFDGTESVTFSIELESGSKIALLGYDQEYNANLIVNAVNNHEALLEACTRVRSWLNEEHKEVLTKRECEEILFKAIQQAEI